MNLVMVSAATMLSVALVVNELGSQHAPHSGQRRAIASNLAQAQSFAFIARLYLKGNPGVSGKVYAATLVAASSTPVQLQGARFPAGWFLKAGTPGALVCTDLDDAAIDSSRDQIRAALGDGLVFAHKDSQACS